jgi:hypothetical protein
MRSLSMVKYLRIYSLSCIIFFIFNCIAFCETSQSTHTASSRLNPQYVFTFLDPPADMKYITRFPWVELLKNPLIKQIGSSYNNYDYSHFTLVYSDGDTLNIDMNWWIMTSELYVEEKVMSLFCCSQIGFYNALDIGKSGDIGYNCWYGGSFSNSNYSIIGFIRNNVVVRITTLMYSLYPDQKRFMDFASEVDQLLIKSEKVSTPSDVPAPVISGAEKIGSSDTGNSIKVKISAYDPQGQKLWFVPLGQPPAIPKSTDGIVSVGIPENTGYSKTIIWVSNEDHIVSAFEKDFFLKAP